MLNIKLLIQGVVCTIAVLAMNTSYADGFPIMDFFNDKEFFSSETKVKTEIPKVKPTLVKNPPSTNEEKPILNTSLQSTAKDKRSKSDKIKQRKTHYGIGYEYRKNMQKQVQRTERLARPEKTQRPERVERPERLERIDRPERIERPDRLGRH